MSDGQTTSLKFDRDKATSVSSSQKGANLDVLGFNIKFIAIKRPSLAIEIMNLYNLATLIQKDDPAAADEDYELAREALGAMKFPRRR